MQGGVALPLSPVRLFGTPWTAACQASLPSVFAWVCSNSCLLSQCWSTIERNGKSLQHSCLQNPMNSTKGQKRKVSRKQTDRRRQAEVCWGVLRITALGEGRRWEVREKLGQDAVTAAFRGGHEGWLDRYTPYPSSYVF